MNIASTQYVLNNRALEIYVTGCINKCPECHNPELQDYTLGTVYHTWITPLIEKITEVDKLIKWIWIMGGEPLDQHLPDLLNLANALRTTGRPLVLFTGHTIEELGSYPKDVLALFDYIKVGRYDATKKGIVDYYGIKLQSLNQKIYTKKELGYE